MSTIELVIIALIILWAFIFGYFCGKNKGYNIGYENGQKVGHDEGIAEGRNLGYDLGFKDCTKQEQAKAEAKAKKNTSKPCFARDIPEKNVFEVERVPFDTVRLSNEVIIDRDDIDLYPTSELVDNLKRQFLKDNTLDPYIDIYRDDGWAFGKIKFVAVLRVCKKC